MPSVQYKSLHYLPTFILPILLSVWLDARTKSTVEKILAKVQGGNKDVLKKHCGLPISTYFSALKLRWLIDNIEEVRKAIADNRCLFGTVDSWLIWVRSNTTIWNHYWSCQLTIYMFLESDWRAKRRLALDWCNERLSHYANEPRNPGMGSFPTQVIQHYDDRISSVHFTLIVDRFFDIPKCILPQIRSSSEIYGFLTCTPLGGIPISGVYPFLAVF